MKSEFWLKICARKSRYSGWELDGVPKTFKSKPATGANEIPIKVNLEIPDSFFEDPLFTLRLSIPEGRPKDVSIEPDLQDGIANLVEQHLGVRCHLSVDCEDEE